MQPPKNVSDDPKRFLYGLAIALGFFAVLAGILLATIPKDGDPKVKTPPRIPPPQTFPQTDSMGIDPATYQVASFVLQTNAMKLTDYAVQAYAGIVYVTELQAAEEAERQRIAAEAAAREEAERQAVAAAAAQAAQRPAPTPAYSSQPQASGGGGGSCSGSVIPDYIVQRESGGNPNAVNASSGAYGCFQIMPYVWSANCSDLSRDAAGQKVCAARISNNGSNLQPWSTG